MKELQLLAWRKAQRSIGNGDCVEIASRTGEIAVRDSKNPGGTVLAYSAGSWQAFTQAARRGYFDVLKH
jgi:Domain of unknown function (DUF397)